MVGICYSTALAPNNVLSKDIYIMIFGLLLATSALGLTQSEVHLAVLPHVSKTLFPEAGKLGCWAKCVRLDLEAKQIQDASVPKAAAEITIRIVPSKRFMEFISKKPSF